MKYNLLKELSKHIPNWHEARLWEMETPELQILLKRIYETKGRKNKLLLPKI